MSGLDSNRVPFVPYSEEYKNSLRFKQARKSKSRVDLRLTNQMLSSIRLIDSIDGQLIIGIDDMSQVAKAYNHIVGDTLPRRNFLGIAEDELNSILLQYPPPEDAIRFEEYIERVSRDLGITRQPLAAITPDEEYLSPFELKRAAKKFKELADVNGFVSIDELDKIFKKRSWTLLYLREMSKAGLIVIVGDPATGAYVL